MKNSSRKLAIQYDINVDWKSDVWSS